jgi:hypothetical protein
MILRVRSYRVQKYGKYGVFMDTVWKVKPFYSYRGKIILPSTKKARNVDGRL